MNTLRIFVDVMRRGSFAAVAREQNLAPSSISRAISALEEELGTRLFYRTTRKLAPTEAATAYFKRLDPLIDELERATQLALDDREVPRGTLRITAPVSFAQVNLVPFLPDFCHQFPEITLELLLTDKMLNLVDDRIDVALRLGKLDDSSMIATRLCDMRYACCASPSYLAKHGVPQDPSDLERHRCLRYPVPGYSSEWYFRRRRDAVMTVPVSGPIVAANGLCLRECAELGMGIVALPIWNVAGAMHEGRLVRVLSEYEVTGSEFDVAAWMLYPSRNYLASKVRCFADFIKEKFRHGAPAEQVLNSSVRRTALPAGAALHDQRTY